HHRVAAPRELATHPAGTAAGVEDPGAPRHHRVDQPRLAVQVLTRGRHRPEPLHVPVRVLRVLLDTTRPQALLDHAAILTCSTAGPRALGVPGQHVVDSRVGRRPPRLVVSNVTEVEAFSWSTVMRGSL